MARKFIQEERKMEYVGFAVALGIIGWVAWSLFGENVKRWYREARDVVEREIDDFRN